MSFHLEKIFVYINLNDYSFTILNWDDISGIVVMHELAYFQTFFTLPQKAYACFPGRNT